MTTTSHADPARLQALSLRVLSVYLALASLGAVWRVIGGSGSIAVLLAYAALAGAMVYSSRGRTQFVTTLGAWLPLLALPVLYVGFPWSGVADRAMLDPMIQGWDRAISGTDPARTFAGVLPIRGVSEVLHAAYLSYYAIIYGPPLLMYLAGAREAFSEAVLAFTLVMVACFVLFAVLPVEGPRYAWPEPAGIPSGPVRSLAKWLLERGSSRGTAFPSSHLAIALSLSLSSCAWRPRLGAVILAATTLLGAGAVYGGFHYLADMLAGTLVGLAGWVVTRRFSARLGAKAAVA